MTICQKCKAENRSEAAFCSRCGTILLVQRNSSKSNPVQPIAPEPQLQESNRFNLATAPVAMIISPEPEPLPVPHHEPQPLPQPEKESPASRFSSRPEGAVFGGHYLFNEVLCENEHEILYTVKEISQPGAPCVRICSNPQCRTIHIPTGIEQENFCTYCGKPLEQDPPSLILQETDAYHYENQAEVIALNLAHPNIHPPISTFQEEQPGGMRYCMVMPYSLQVPTNPEIQQVLEWGLQLAAGLDYLHSHGIAFSGEVDGSAFGLVGDRIAWRNFASALVLPMLPDREKINDVRLLALTLYTWITGRVNYVTDTSLHPRLNRLFHQALVGEGFTSGTELAEQIQLAIKSGLSTFNLDYQIGRRTHPGKVRAINEDSLLSMTISSIQQGISQPQGIIVIADGMGGHSSGELASSVAVQAIARKASLELPVLQSRTPEEHVTWLKNTAQAANQAVFESRQVARNDMGSTLACALLIGTRAYITNLGDSRVYLIREGSLQQITTDHTLVQQMVETGKISPEQVRNHPQRNVIYRSLGEASLVDVEVIEQNLQSGDILLVCSDGLSNMLDAQKIQVLIHEASSPQVACDYLVDAANLAGGEDNISVILAEVISA